MERSEAFVRWYRQAADAQDGNRPNLEDDLEEAGRAADDGGETRKNPYHQKNGKFGFKPIGAIGGAPALPPKGTPKQVAAARVKQAEIAEPKLTALTGKLAKKHGGEQAGLDFKIKGEGSMARKIEADVRESGGSLTPAKAAEQLFDANRYTTVFPAEHYAKGAQGTLEDLRADGHTVNVKNYWLNDRNPYQGVNVQVTTTAGDRFELQFHTADSLDVKEGALHTLYEEARVSTDPARIAELNKQMFVAASSIPVPVGIGDVG
jgi:hypothetical protein